MNKKGFTLVELLAVIAILAILVIIAMPNVLEMFNKAKQDAFETEVKSHVKSVSGQYITTGKLIYSNVVEGAHRLPMDGEELDYYIVVDTRGNIKTLNVTNGSYKIEVTGTSQNPIKIEQIGDIIKSEIAESGEEFEMNSSGSITGDVMIEPNTINSFNELKEAFKTSGTIVLGSDIVVTAPIIINGGISITLNMNGKTITVADGFGQASIFDLQRDLSSLTIEGNGTFNFKKNYKSMLATPRGNFTINSGRFIKEYDTSKIISNHNGFFVGVTDSSTAASKKGKTVINGGYFDGGFYKSDTTNGIISILNLGASQNFKIYGGTFVGYNPAVGDEGTGRQGYFLLGQTASNQLPSGYSITEGVTQDGRPTYTVSYSK